MIKILLFLLIIYSQENNLKLNLENYANKENLKNLLEVDDNSLKFIAFYNKDDLSENDIKFLNDFQEVINDLVSEKLYNVEIYFYNDTSIPIELEKKYHLYKYTLPKIKMNKQGKLLTYKGSNKKFGIKNFINREYRDFKIYYDTILNVEQLKDRYNKFNEIIFYYGEKFHPIFLKFIEFSKKFNDIKFIFSENKEVYEYIYSNLPKKERDYQSKFPYLYFIKKAVSNSIELFTIMHNEFNEIKKFLKMMRRNKLYSIPPKMMKKFLKYNEPILMLVSSGLYEKETNEVCYKLSEINCTMFNDSHNEFDYLRNFLNHEKGKEALYIIDPTDLVNNSPYKYKLNDMINKENIKNFIYNWKNNKLKPFWKSEKEIDNSNNLVYELVGNNYTELIENSKSDVFVFIHSDDCKTCQNIKIDFIKVALYLNKYHKEIPLKLMMIDGKKNEIPKLNYNQIPLFLMYSRKNYKSPNPAYFEFTYEGILYYIKTKTPFLNEFENNIEL